MKRLLASCLGLLALAAFAGWAAMSASAATRNVGVVDDTYVDAVSTNNTTTINAGDTVQWNWSGSNQHTVSSTSAEVFDSGAPQTTGSYSHVFSTVGSFSYICGIHGTAMTGTIVVQAAQAPTNTPQATNTTAAQPTNTPATSASSTPASTGPTNTPASGATSAPATQLPSTPATSGTQAGGGALPSAGTGSGSDGSPWAMFAALAAIAGLVLAGAAALRVFRRPEF